MKVIFSKLINVVIILSILLFTGCNQAATNNKTSEVQRPESEIDNLINKVGLNDVVWFTLEKDGSIESAPRDAIVVWENNKDLMAKLLNAIRLGSIENGVPPNNTDSKGILMGFKLGNGKYIETRYTEKGFSLLAKDTGKDSLITLKPTQEFDDLIGKIIERKLQVAAQLEKDNGQVRNNQLILARNSLHRWWDDSVFKSFQGSEKSPRDYEQSLINEAISKGIDESKLRETLEVAKVSKGPGITVFPVIIDTGYYKDRECFVYVFTWEGNGMFKPDGKVKSLGHIYIVAVDSLSKKIIMQLSCS